MQLRDFLGICRFFLSVPFNPVVAKKKWFFSIGFSWERLGRETFQVLEWTMSREELENSPLCEATVQINVLWVSEQHVPLKIKGPKHCVSLFTISFMCLFGEGVLLSSF